MKWTGVMPAVTTPFRDDFSVDHSFLTKHCQWLVEHGATAIVPLGSLGEGATLSYEEKRDILRSCVSAVGDQVPIVPGVSSLSTPEAVSLARDAAEIGCQGLMVLPPYVYSTDWREMSAHVEAVISATQLSCMIYNNPIAYGTDFLPEQIAELVGRHDNVHAVKESSGNVRRVAAIRTLLGDRVQIFAGLDDVILESLQMGATGWVAGLVNALPKESVAVYEHATAGEFEKAFDIYSWFLPLLRLDTVPKFVQLIKLVQAEVGMGSERVRAPRMELVGEERSQALAIIKESLANRPTLD